jgi:hypothetical protein
MNKNIAGPWIFVLAACVGFVGVCRADTAPTATAILGLCDAHGARIDGNAGSDGVPLDSDVRLDGWLWVVVRTSADPGDALAIAPDCGGLEVVKPGTSSVPEQPGGHALLPPVQLEAAEYALMLDGRELQGLRQVRYDPRRHAFGFRLVRNGENESAWRDVLGSPSGSHRTVTVALRQHASGESGSSTIEGVNGSAVFRLRVFSLASFWAAVAIVAAVLAVVVGTAWRTTTLRDSLLPQLPANEQPYSLGRCQMAFWFILVFASFIFLYVLLWDYNTVSDQALVLMGIASATALASVAVDIYKDSPADAANRTLQALGLKAPSDLIRVRQEIAERTPLVESSVARRHAAQDAAASARAASDRLSVDPKATAEEKSAADKAADDAAELASVADRDLKTLQAEIQDRRNVIRTYEDTVAPFRSECFFRDLTTDLSGPTVHRLQVFFWTLALGGVFLIGVYRDLAMPNFSATLLALMGVSGAGYVGFKYPERNN